MVELRQSEIGAIQERLSDFRLDNIEQSSEQLRIVKDQSTSSNFTAELQADIKCEDVVKLRENAEFENVRFETT